MEIFLFTRRWWWWLPVAAASTESIGKHKVELSDLQCFIVWVKDDRLGFNYFFRSRVTEPRHSAGFHSIQSFLLTKNIRNENTKQKFPLITACCGGNGNNGLGNHTRATKLIIKLKPIDEIEHFIALNSNFFLAQFMSFFVSYFDNKTSVGFKPRVVEGKEKKIIFVEFVHSSL